MLVVIQGTPFCNLNCSYCYLPGRDVKKRIRIETIERLVSAIPKMARPPEDVRVVWHAGEPLVLPPSFYEEAFAVFSRLRESGIEVNQGFQTNGTLINAAWVDFFLRHHPSVGVSVDGPRSVHNANRQYHSGAGSWDRCMHGIKQLHDANVSFHTISVLTTEAMRKPIRMFEFFYDSQLHDIAFNIEEIEGINTRSDLLTDGYEALYGNFMRKFISLNAASGFPLRIRETESAAAALLNDGIAFNSQTEPGGIISLDVDGNVSTFSPELLGLTSEAFSNYIIGNIWQNTLDEMLGGQVATALAREISAGVAHCERSCEFFRFCKGGAPANKLGETGSFRTAETRFCRLTIKSTIQICVNAVFDLVTNTVPAGELPDE